MNKNYYTIISRDEFIKLYRFGNIKVSTNFILNNDKNIENKIIELFKISSFEYEEGYLILKVIEENIAIDLDLLTIKTVYNLELKHIQSVYVLSNQAMEFYKTKVNSKINFQICPFDNILKQVSDFKEYQDINQGINILSEQFDFMNREEIDIRLGSDFKSDFLKSDDYLSLDFKDFYLDLLSYKRENKFTKDDIGYIYDLMVIALLKQRKPESINKFKQGLLRLDGSPAYQILDANKKETLFESIKFIQEIDDENIKKFTDNITFNHLVSGAIFLKMRKLLLERDENTQQQLLNIVDNFSSKYKDSLSMALYLIGLVFGYKNLYEDYYDFIELEIFKDAESNRIELVEQNKNINLVELEDKIKTLKDDKIKLNKDLVNTNKEFEELSLSNEKIKDEKELLNEKYELLSKKYELLSKKLEKEEIQESNNEQILNTDLIELKGKIKTLEEQNCRLELSIKTAKEESEFQDTTISTVTEPVTIYDIDKNNHISPITNDEILKFSRSHLVDIAKSRGIETPTSKIKYPKGDEGQVKLYNAIINTKKNINEVENQINKEEKSEGLFN